jgi:hypothetical protein
MEVDHRLLNNPAELLDGLDEAAVELATMERVVQGLVAFRLEWIETLPNAVTEMWREIAKGY